MRVTYFFMASATLVAPVLPSVFLTPTAAAECTNAGGVTVCAQGDVRGPDTGEGAGYSGPVVPYPCEYDWYCDDWDMDVIVDPGPPGPGGPGGGIDIGRPGRPGIGPR